MDFTIVILIAIVVILGTIFIVGTVSRRKEKEKIDGLFKQYEDSNYDLIINELKPKTDNGRTFKRHCTSQSGPQR